MTSEAEEGQHQQPSRRGAKTSVIGALISLAGAIVSLVTFVPTYNLSQETHEFNQKTFERNQEAQNEAAAVSAMQNHLALAAENPEYTTAPRQLPNEKYENLSKEEQKYTWYASHTLFTAETIHNLKANSWDWDEEDAPWKGAAAQFVSENKPYIIWNTNTYGDKGSVCTQFTKGFTLFIEDQVGEVCNRV